MMTFLLRVELSPAEARAFEWLRRGQCRPSSVPAMGHLSRQELRDYLQRRLNTQVSNVVNQYLDALVEVIRAAVGAASMDLQSMVCPA